MENTLAIFTNTKQVCMNTIGILISRKTESSISISAFITTTNSKTSQVTYPDSAEEEVAPVFLMIASFVMT